MHAWLRACQKSWLRNSLFICIAISLLIHLGVWLGLHVVKARPFNPNEFNKNQQKIEVTILNKKPEKKAEEKQIVQQSKHALNNEINKNAKYLSANNQTVIHETRASHSGAFQNSAGTGANDFKSHPQTQPSPQLASRSHGARAKAHAQIHDQGTLPTLADLSPSFSPSQVVNFNNSDSGNGQAPSQTDDYLKNTAPGMETLLNTRQFVYYTYYQRIRARIRQYWAPCVREQVKKIFAEGRTIASTQDHITRVIIVLDRNGNLVTVEIVGRSGIKELDDAAIEAFREAAPFPNPPKGIVGHDGYIRIDWDFILQADNTSTLVLEHLYAAL